jgi:hypothetical protein
MSRHFVAATIAAFAIVSPVQAQVTGGVGPGDSVVAVPIAAPRTPLPSEAASSRVTKFSFIAYGDTRGEFDGFYPNSSHLSVVSEMVRRIRARAATDSAIKFVVQSGDAVLDGRVLTQLNVSYVPVINQLTQVADVPYYLAVGNHDVRNSPILTDTDRVKGLKNYFAINAHLIPAEGSARRLNGYPTYAVAYGNTFVILYDSQIAGDSVQYEWIRKQLEGLDRRRFVNIVAVSHHPAFSSGPHGAATIESSTQIIRDLYMPLFHKHHVKLLLTGHEHLFEHWVERYADSTGTYRLDQIVSGGGGAPLYGYRGEPDLGAYRRANPSVTRIDHLVKPEVDPGANPFHFVIVNVDGPKIWLEVVAPYWANGFFNPYRTNKVNITP